MDIGQHEVKDHQIIRLNVFSSRGGPVRAPTHNVASTLKRADHFISEVRIILDYQDFRHLLSLLCLALSLPLSVAFVLSLHRVELRCLFSTQHCTNLAFDLLSMGLQLG